MYLCVSALFAFSEDQLPEGKVLLNVSVDMVILCLFNSVCQNYTPLSQVLQIIDHRGKGL